MNPRSSSVPKKARPDPPRPCADFEGRPSVPKPGSAVGSLALLGVARTFRAVRTTADWMMELRGGDNA
jgi:hypothetical protein